MIDMPSQSMATVGKGQCNNQLLIDVTEDRYTTDSSTCSRLPPDGHEFPPNYQETLNCSTNNNCSNNSPTNKTTMSLMDMELDIGVDLDDGSVLKPPWGFEDTLNVPPPPTLPPPGKTCEKRNTGKRNDDLKANLSVKDKIAMFASLEDVSIIKQNEPSPPPCFVDVSPFTTTLVISKEKEDTGYSSWDKDRDILGGSSTTSTVIPNVPPAPKAEFQHWRSVTNLMVHNDRPESSLSTSSTLSRSSDDLGNRYTSKMSMYPQTASSSDDNDHDQVGNDKEKKLMQRRSLYSLMESRMQTVSKLRGLVIPDAPRDSKDASASVEHLPTIVTAVQVAVPQKMEYKSTLEMTPNAVSNNNNNNNKEVIPQLPELPPPLPPAPRPAPRTNATFRKNSGGDSIDVDVPSTAPPPPVAPPRVVTGKEGKPALERAVSAPQIDADADESVRILKANSVEAINRMNVLRSAKTSSGARVALVDIAIEDATPQKVTTNTETRQEPAVRVATINVVAHSDSEDEVDEEEEEDMEVEEDEVVASTNVSSTPLTRTEALVTIARKLSVEESLEKKPIQVNESTCNGVEAVPIVPVAVPVAVPKAQVSSEKWSELEQKYGPKAEKREKVDCPNSSVPPPRMPSTLPRNLSGIGNGNGNENGNNKNFRTIADKWQERASTEPSTAATLPRSTWKSEHVPNMLPLVPGRKLSAPPSSAPVPPPVPVPSARGVTMRDNSNKRMSLAPRPASMVENGSDRKLKAWDPNNVTASNGSYLATGRKANTGKATSFGDLRQVFEKQDSVAAVTNFRVRKVDGGEQHVNGSIGSRNNVNHYNNHARMSSLDSTASGDSDAPVHYSSANCLPSAVDHYGSVTSLSSSTSLISSQELQQLIEEANQSLEESGTQCQEVMVVVLQRESMGGSVGVTLAGGADYDSKEITINRIIKGGLAEKDGRIQQGDRVISVNGKHLRGVTHKEALNILKAPRSDCVLVLSRNRTSSVGTDDGGTAKSGDLITASEQKTVDTTTTSTTTTVTSNETVAAPVTTMTNGKCEVCLEIVKDGSGLGFTLDGGKQSLLGDKALTVKKIFSDKGGVLKVGDEILSINDTDATNMARSEAWNFMRKLPDGVVKLVVRQSS